MGSDLEQAPEGVPHTETPPCRLHRFSHLISITSLPPVWAAFEEYFALLLAEEMKILHLGVLVPTQNPLNVRLRDWIFLPPHSKRN